MDIDRVQTVRSSEAIVGVHMSTQTRTLVIQFLYTWKR